MTDDEALRKHASSHVDDPSDVDDLVARVRRRLAWRRARGYKTCSSCGEDKQPVDFGVNPARSDGLHNACLVCERERWRRRKTP